MDRHSVFMTAFWAGLASPAAVYASAPGYRPQIRDLTFFAPFAVVGEFITLSLPEQNDGRTANSEPAAVADSDGEQLSLGI